MAHKKDREVPRNGRDSNSQRRGVKVYGGESIHAGSIIVRQVGTKIHPAITWVWVKTIRSMQRIQMGLLKIRKDGLKREKRSVCT